MRNLEHKRQRLEHIFSTYESDSIVLSPIPLLSSVPYSSSDIISCTTTPTATIAFVQRVRLHYKLRHIFESTSFKHSID
jgi:hypothetical protein